MIQDPAQDVTSEHDSEDAPVAEEQSARISSSGLGDQLDQPSPSPRGRWRRRRPLRHQPKEENLSSQLAHHLREASTQLVDRLFDYLSNCPPPSSNEPTEDSSSLQQLPPQRGLTLPASAIGWLSLNLYPDSNHIGRLRARREEQNWWMEIPMRDRLPLIKYLLPRATHLRITSDEWPPTPSTRKGKDSIDSLLEEAVDQDQSLSFTYPPSSESPTVEEEERDFLLYFYALRCCPRVDMRVFPNLSVLLVDRVPPEWIINLNMVNDKLELFRMERGCVYDLASLLCPLQQEDNVSLDERENEQECKNDSDAAFGHDGSMLVSKSSSRRDCTRFPKLTHLKLSECAIGELSGLTGKRLCCSDDHESTLNDEDFSTVEEDERVNGADRCSVGRQTPVSIPPLSLLSNLVSLNLAHNDIVYMTTALAGLESLSFLSKLDLSFNRLSCMDNAFQMLGNLKILLLSGNYIRNCRGLDRLYSLEHLALDRNNFRDLADVAGLASLPELSILDLYGNPLEQRNPKKYRVGLLNLFRECRYASIAANASYRHLLQILPILDGQISTKKELVALRYLTFDHSISSPSTTKLSTRREKGDGIKGNENSPGEKDLRLNHDSTDSFPLSSTMDKDLVTPTVAPIELKSAEHRIHRVTRRVRTRKVRIADSAGERNLPSKSARTERNEGRTRLNLDFEQNHVFLKPAIKMEEMSGDRKTMNVKFSVHDVISSLPIASSIPFRMDDVDEESSSNDNHEVSGDGIDENVGAMEEPNVARISPGNVLKADGVCTEGEGDTFSEKSSNSEGLPKPAADLSLLSLSTVMPDEESVGKQSDQQNSVAANEEHSRDGEETLVNGADKQNPYLNNSSLTASEVVTEMSADQVASVVLDTERDDRELLPSGVDSSADTPMSGEMHPRDETAGRKILDITFPENIWDDEVSVPTSSVTRKDDTPAKVKWRVAEQTSVYDGPEGYRHLNVLVNLELYFQCFVFPNSSTTMEQPWYGEEDDSDLSASKLRLLPRIQLCKTDRDAHQKSDKFNSRESFRHVWNEEVVACGKPAAARLAPNKTPRRGFHGDILFAQGKLATVSECRKMIFCSSSAALYIISDYDAVTIQAQKKLKKRQFPLPIPEDALFEDAPWPHAVSRHSISLLHRITIGFGFQRLTLHFSVLGSGNQEFTYILITCNKLKTISLLQQLQEQVKDSDASGMADRVEDSITIDNDDKQVLDALSAAVAPAVVGIVLHYQILQQRWKHGDRGSVRRVCVVTDTGLFLLDEDYVGDGSTGSYEATDGSALGDISLKLVESAELHQIVEVQAADADPRSITIIIRPQSRLKRTHRWRLLCRDGDGAERLVDDVRKAISAT